MLIKLKAPVKFTDKIQPACLTMAEPATGTKVTASGWGAMESSGESSDDLLKVVVPIVSRDQCRVAHEPEEITEKMICAGYPEGGKDTCQGDSGGTLTPSIEAIHVVNQSLALFGQLQELPRLDQ